MGHAQIRLKCVKGTSEKLSTSAGSDKYDLKSSELKTAAEVVNIIMGSF
jgi:hypothetical protein